jgi:hypothetical protein
VAAAAGEDAASGADGGSGGGAFGFAVRRVEVVVLDGAGSAVLAALGAASFAVVR